jgi:lysophospholipase L1-like esterase
MGRRRLRAAAIGAAALALAALGSASSAAAAPHVLVVGDSLEELTSPYLSRFLPGVRLTVNAVGGYNSYQIYDLFQESYEPSQSVIVFDAGTNDNPNYPEILAGNLQKVAAQVGERCVVVPTIHGFTVEGADNTGKNRVVARFAASRPGTQVPDWASVAETQPELMQSDDLHPTPEGAEYRAQLIAQGVAGCLDYARARAAAPATSQVEPVHLAPVGRLAERRRALIGEIGMAVLREGVAAALAGALAAQR